MLSFLRKVRRVHLSSSCRIAAAHYCAAAPFYEQEVVKAFAELTHESSAKCLFTSSPERRRGVKILI